MKRNTTLKHLELGQSWSCASGYHAPPLCLLPLFPVCMCACICVCVCVCRYNMASVSCSGAFIPISALPIPVSSPLPAHLSLMSYATEFKFRVLTKLSLSIKSWCAFVLLTSCLSVPRILYASSSGHTCLLPGDSSPQLNQIK